MSYNKKYHKRDEDITIAAVNLVTWLQSETHRQSCTPIADCMHYCNETDLYLYSRVARNLAGSGLIDDVKLSRKHNGEWYENGVLIAENDELR